MSERLTGAAPARRSAMPPAREMWSSPVRNLHGLAGDWTSAMVDASADAIISLDERLVVLTWNAGATRMYGRSADEMIGRSVLEIPPPGLAGQFHRWLDAAWGDGLVRHHRTGHMHAVRGRWIPVLLTVAPITARCGSVCGLTLRARPA